MQLALFIIFGGLALAGAINLLAQKAPIHSALSLVLVMGSLAVLFLLLGAEFIAFIQILVYAGAIMVLFVFVIMLLNAQPSESSRGSRAARWLGLPVAGLLGIILSALVASRYRRVPANMGQPMFHIESIGEALFHQYLLPFEVTSVLFLVGVTGAVMLAARPEEQTRLEPEGRRAEAKAISREKGAGA